MSTITGQEAEAIAADYLRRQGFVLLARNWRTRWCEIDIVAQQGTTIYFVEVKYRSRTDWGTGLEYITRRKLRQMHFAAHFWMSQHPAKCDYCLGALGMVGVPPRVADWVAPIV